MIGFDIYPSVGGPMQTFAAKKAKDVAFYRRNVKHKVDQIVYKALGRYGAFVRHRAMSMLKPAPGPSRYGSPPHSHPNEGGGALLKRFILFDRMDRGASVVVGPKLLQGSGVGRDPWGSIAVPGLLEHGGHVSDEDGDDVLYRERPFMAPAMKAGWKLRHRFFRQAMTDVIGI